MTDLCKSLGKGQAFAFIYNILKVLGEGAFVYATWKGLEDGASVCNAYYYRGLGDGAFICIARKRVEKGRRSVEKKPCG